MASSSFYRRTSDFVPVDFAARFFFFFYFETNDTYKRIMTNFLDSKSSSHRYSWENDIHRFSILPRIAVFVLQITSFTDLFVTPVKYLSRATNVGDINVGKLATKVEEREVERLYLGSSPESIDEKAV